MTCTPYLGDARVLVAPVVVSLVTGRVGGATSVRVDEADVDDEVQVGPRELCRVLVDGVHGDVRVLQAEALGGN